MNLLTNKSKKNVLIIDDEANARSGLKMLLESLGCKTLEAASGAEGLDLFHKFGADLILSDVRMPGISGFTVLETLTKEAPEIPVVLITAYGSGDSAREALQKGAYDFISKPFDLDTIELVIKRALKLLDLEVENKNLKSKFQVSNSFDSIVGKSSQINEVFETIKQVAPTKSNVLIEGESGTGKELIARAIHDFSPRKDMPFVPLHCASFSENLLESELFGHEKGAFTGAISQRKGRFELAKKGTLFLDEVSTISQAVQVKLLRVLQERQLERVGGSETINIDVRIVSATNISLKKMISEGKFREDLFYRLNVVNLNVPPLRNRRGDIKLLITHFLKSFNKEIGKKVSISKLASEILENYNWPGNVRELQNTIESLVVLCHGHEVTPRDLPAHILAPAKKEVATEQIEKDFPDLDSLTIEEMERFLILRKLKKIKNRTEVAKQLGISRRNLYRKMKEYGVE